MDVTEPTRGLNSGARGRAVDVPCSLMEKQCISVEHYTPRRVVDAVHHYFRLRGKPGIVLDPCTIADNPTRAMHHLTEADDGLGAEWKSGTFVNPPYGKQIRRACASIIRAARAGFEVVALLPCSRSEQAYWQDLWHTGLVTCDVQVRKRLHFLQRAPDGTYAEARGNPYASQILCFCGDFDAAVEAFGALGTCKQYARVVAPPAAPAGPRQTSFIEEAP